VDLVEPDQFTHAAGRSGPRRRTSGVCLDRRGPYQRAFCLVPSQLHEFGAGSSDPAWPPAMGCSPEGAAAACPDCLGRLVLRDLAGSGLSFVHGLSDSPLPFAASAVVQVRAGSHLLISGRSGRRALSKPLLAFPSVQARLEAEFIGLPFLCINPCFLYKSYCIGCTFVLILVSSSLQVASDGDEESNGRYGFTFLTYVRLNWILLQWVDAVMTKLFHSNVSMCMMLNCYNT
jgi:hypothetical protein